MEKFRDVYIEQDKTNAPFLLAASFSKFIRFEGSHFQAGILYWYFSPKEKAKELLLQLRTKTEPHIPAKDLFEAISLFWQQLYAEKNKSR